MPSESSIEVRYRVVGLRDDVTAVVLVHHLTRDQAEQVAKALSGDPEFQRIEIRLEHDMPAAGTYR